MADVAKNWAKRSCVPAKDTLFIAASWLGWYFFIMIGAAIFQAVDNPRRESIEAGKYTNAGGQVKLSYLDALYFFEVAVSSCGLGDIVPVTDDGRGVLFVWSFVGTGLMGCIVGASVLKLLDWLYLGVFHKTIVEIRKKGEDDEDKEAQSLTEKVLPWYVLFIVNGVAVVNWFVVHLIYAGVLYEVEPNLANLDPDLTSTGYDGYFYFVLVASQTICFGTDYNPKLDDGRIFWLFWHPTAMMANAFLFVTVALALLKWFNAKVFWVIGHAVAKIKGEEFDGGNNDL